MPAERFDVVHARLLRFFPELVAELGGDPNALLSEVGIRAELHDGHVGATYSQTIAVIGHAAQKLACPDFGMRLAVRQGGAMFGPLGQVMKNSRTFGEALEYVASHAYAHSLAARIWLRRLAGGSGLFSGHDILVDGVPNRAQAIEQILLVGGLFAREITGGAARVRRVHFRHQPISPLRTYRRYFGCEVRFGQNQDGVVYSDRDLASLILASDPLAYQAAVNFIEARFAGRPPPVHAQVRGAILPRLWSGACSNAEVAADLRLHPRTLHRRLTAEGTSFQQIKDEVRRDILLYYLQQTEVDFTTLSDKLGFAEQSVLTRRCRGWFGAPPSALRRRLRAGSSVSA